MENQKDLQGLVLKQVEQQIGNVAIVLGYLEHQMDLTSSLVADIAQEVGVENLSENTRRKLELVNTLLQASSIDTDNLQSPYESYKVPQALDMKRNIRNIQAMYLKAAIK